MPKITTNVSEKMHELKEKYNLKWSEAVRIGIGLLLLEKGHPDYISPLNKFRVELMYKSLPKEKNA